jgi:hypothetical protein
MDTHALSAEAAQLFDIQVQQIAGSRMFVALRHRTRLQIPHPIQLQATQYAAHRGPAQSRVLGNAQARPAFQP